MVDRKNTAYAEYRAIFDAVPGSSAAAPIDEIEAVERLLAAGRVVQVGLAMLAVSAASRARKRAQKAAENRPEGRFDPSVGIAVRLLRSTAPQQHKTWTYLRWRLAENSLPNGKRRTREALAAARREIKKGLP